MVIAVLTSGGRVSRRVQLATNYADGPGDPVLLFMLRFKIARDTSASQGDLRMNSMSRFGKLRRQQGPRFRQ